MKKLSDWIKWFVWSIFMRIAERATENEPDFVIGSESDPYLLRWYVIPRNPIFNIYVHRILTDDEDRALHDHPWFFFSYILSGGYYEVLPTKVVWRKPTSWYIRGMWTPHRLQLAKFPPDPATGIARSIKALTIIFTGPVLRRWGFHCPNGWRYWKDFVAVREGGNSTGAGCG